MSPATTSTQNPAPASAPTENAAAFSTPRLLLHLEGFAAFITAIILYADREFSGWAFALLFLVPDLAALGYLRNLKIGALTYNLVHTYVMVGVLVAIGWFLDIDLALQLGLILMAHIGIDRTLGYGLKYPSAFKDTHLQRL
jgi:hypothetical protein